MQTKTRRSSPRRIWLWVLLATFTVACENSNSTTETVVGDPSFITLHDGATGGDNPRFFFLPPLAPHQDFIGVLDPDLSARVYVDNVPVGTAELNGDHYLLIWTPSAVVQASVISVRVGAIELGSANVEVVGPRGRRGSGDFRVGQSVPVQFRIEEGGTMCDPHSGRGARRA